MAGEGSRPGVGSAVACCQRFQIRKISMAISRESGECGRKTVERVATRVLTVSSSSVRQRPDEHLGSANCGQVGSHPRFGVILPRRGAVDARRVDAGDSLGAQSRAERAIGNGAGVGTKIWTRSGSEADSQT